MFNSNYRRVELKPKTWPKIRENFRECVLFDIGGDIKFPLRPGSRNFTTFIRIKTACSLQYTVGAGFIWSILGFYKITELPITNPVKFVS